MEGTLSYSARHKRPGQDRHAGKHTVSERRHLWAPSRRNRAEAGHADLPADQESGVPRRFKPAGEYQE